MAQSIITQISPINQQDQLLNSTDSTLVTSITTNASFNVETDIIETFVYNINNVLIQPINTSYTVQNTSVDNNEIKELFIDPVRDLESSTFTTGIYNVNYSFLRNKLDSSIFNQYYIKDISNDRTELRIDNTNLTNVEIQAAFDNFSIDLNTSPVFNGFYLNFGNNNLELATNIALDVIDGRNTILIKLYEPLPSSYGVKTQFWVVEKVSDPLAYQVEFINDQVVFDDRIFLKGPNFNIPVQDQVNNSTEYKTYNTLFTSSTGLQNQLSSLLTERRAELDTDYSDYDNFVFFSSAQQRLSNFYDKATLIESYNNDITILDSLPNTTQVSSSKVVIQNKIDALITNFDGYDYYLYFDSSSTAWPKSNSTKPYTLYSTGSSQVLTWYNSQINSASLYDNENQNNLYNIFPQYIQEDSDNDQFHLFVDMAAQLFDEIWLYTQAIKNRQDGDNSLSGGISKDLVADALRSYGINIYQSSFTTSDLFTSYLGITSGGSLLPPTGSEVITNYVTSSAEMIPFDDAQKLIYKRLYHNLPYLLKKKGTIDGLRTLLTCFGVPDTIIQTVEFGGKNKTNENDWDYFEDRFNYTFTTSGSGFVNIPWRNLGNSNKFPKVLEFRFKSFGLLPYVTSAPYVVDGYVFPGYMSNNVYSLLNTDNNEFFITLDYTGSGLTSGSYSASIADPYNEYGTLTFYHSASNASASVYMPIFNGGWWSLMVSAFTGSSSTYQLYVKDNIYDGYEGNKIGFQASSSFTSNTWWDSKGTGSVYLGGSGSVSYLNQNLSPFPGYYQEFRYYTTNLSESSFNDYVMNPLSIEGNNISGSYDTLLFRASLGAELYTNTSSIHPSYNLTASFSGSNLFSYTGSYSFQPNVETLYYDTPAIGMLDRTSNKIKLQDNSLPSGDVLSPLASISQATTSTGSVSNNNNLLEVGFSPQNEIDKDIIEQYGYFNIGEYIGDPRQVANKTYTDLKPLRDAYFKKYTSPYDYSDYVRLIKYFDNALFKMIKDFVPARTSISTGIIIKPTILERPKYPEPQASWTRPEYTASIKHHSGSDTIYLFSGDNGGLYSGQTSSFTESFSGPSGIFNIAHTDNAEFYNGELKGTTLIVTTQSLQNNPLLGTQYRESIGDLQNLNVNISGSFFESGSNNEFKIGTLPFKITNSPSTIYNTTTYTYTPAFNVISDISIILEGAWSNQTGNARFYIYFVENGTNILTSIQFENIGTGTIESFNETLIIPTINLNNNSTYSVLYVFQSLGVNERTISLSSLTQWTAITPNPFAQSIYYNDPTVYTQQNFPGDIGLFDDYYAIYNNVYSNRVSNKYFDVDYSNGISSPTNFTSIISGSAIYAQVQPSNYTLRRHINPRYEGSKLFGSTINQFTTGDTSYANKPVIERYTDYVAQYDYVEQGANSIIHILSLIDIDGNKIALNGNTNFNFGMVKTIFPQSSSVSLVDLTTNSAGLNTSGSARISSSIDENNIYIYGAITKTDIGLVVPSNFNPYIDVYEVARKAGLI
jgi:hypothetical protein